MSIYYVINGFIGWMDMNATWQLCSKIRISKNKSNMHYTLKQNKISLEWLYKW